MRNLSWASASTAPSVDPDKEWGPDHPLRHEAYGCRGLGEKTCHNLGAHKLEEYSRRLDRLWEAELKFDPYPERIVAHHVHKFSLHPAQWQDQDIVTASDVGRMGYHDPYMEIYRRQYVRYMTLKGAADGALVDGIERIHNLGRIVDPSAVG
ncbi:unnamed protein product [Linum trigynum]|uniref:Uncharacterized protein n=1 Tax=Linum trigynum TaxID=586398 RepID=A0AAV2F967_9ROSI